MRKNLRCFVSCLLVVGSIAVLAGCGSAPASAIDSSGSPAAVSTENLQGEDASPAERMELLKQIEEKIQSMETTLESLEAQADDAQSALVEDLQEQIASLKETATLLRDSIEEK